MKKNERKNLMKKQLEILKKESKNTKLDWIIYQDWNDKLSFEVYDGETYFYDIKRYNNFNEALDFIKIYKDYIIKFFEPLEEEEEY